MIDDFGECVINILFNEYKNNLAYVCTALSGIYNTSVVFCYYFRYRYSSVVAVVD